MALESLTRMLVPPSGPAIGGMEDFKRELGEEIDAMVRERLGAAAVFVLTVTLGLTFLEWLGSSPLLSRDQFAIRSVIVAASFGVLVALRSRHVNGRGVQAAILLVGLTQISVAAVSVLRGSTDINAGLALVLTLVAAALFPWGWPRQLLVTANAISAVYWNVFLIGSWPTATFSAPDFAVGFVGFIASIFVAQQLRAWLERSTIETLRVRRAQLERERLLVRLEAINRELERFVYTVSHDLKGPLITLRGFANLLREDLQAENPARAVEDAEQIDRAAERMARLLEDLLALSRVGRVADPTETVSMSDLAADVVVALEGPIAEAGGTVEIEEGMPRVLVDRVRMGEVLQNLVENALKFRKPGTAAQVRVGLAGIEGEDLVFAVSDDGVGVDEAYHDKVFGLFDRLNPDVPGTGVGLALVRRIIDVHGGRVWLESGGEGCGATVKFTLPRAPGEPWPPGIGDDDEPASEGSHAGT
jgi:signal transduction histidine kinase